MPKVFISYRRKDTDASAGRLYDKLCPAFGKENVFYDVDAIDLGVDFVKELQNRIGNCDVLLALIGPRWEMSRLQDDRDFVRLEIAAALERDIRVIPVLVDGVALPEANDLPKPLVPLLNRNALDLNHARFHNDCERLIRAIERAPASPRASPPARTPPPAPKIAVASEVFAAENGIAARIRNLGLEPVSFRKDAVRFCDSRRAHTEGGWHLAFGYVRSRRRQRGGSPRVLCGLGARRERGH